MRHFQFRLSSLLQVRQAERDNRQSLLADALAEERELHGRRALLERDLHAQLGRARIAAGPGGLDIATLAASQRYTSSLRAHLAALAEQERIVAQAIDRRREAVVEADREVSVLERLRERQHEQHRALQARAESKQLDEVAVQTTNRQPIA